MGGEKKIGSKKAVEAPKEPMQMTLLSSQPRLAKQPRQHYAAGLALYRMKGARGDRDGAAEIVMSKPSGSTKGFFTEAELTAIPQPENKDLGRITRAKIRVISPFQLGAQELRTMHAIMGHVTLSKPEKVKHVALSPTTDRGQVIAGALGYKPASNVPTVVGDAMPFLETPSTVRIETSLREIAATCGLAAGGVSHKTIAAALIALESTQVSFMLEWEAPSKDGGDPVRGLFKSEVRPLIKTTKMVTDRGPGRFSESVMVSIDPHVLRSIATNGSHRIIDLDEVRALKQEASVLLHNYLCGFVDQGAQARPQRVGLDTMIRAIYPEDGGKEPTKDMMKKRRGVVKRAIQELIALGWKFTPYTGSTPGYVVERPKARRGLDVIDVAPLNSSSPLLEGGE